MINAGNLLAKTGRERTRSSVVIFMIGLVIDTAPNLATRQIMVSISQTVKSVQRI